MKHYRLPDGSVLGRSEGQEVTGEMVLMTDEELAAHTKLPYTDERLQEYPNIGDQLDAIWKQFNQMRLDGAPLIQEADDMLGDILAVKSRHKKPE